MLILRVTFQTRTLNFKILKENVLMLNGIFQKVPKNKIKKQNKNLIKCEVNKCQ